MPPLSDPLCRINYLSPVEVAALEGVYKCLEEIARKNKTGNVGVACGTDRELAEIILNYYKGVKA